MAELSAHASLTHARDGGGKGSRKGDAQQATAAGLDLLRVLGWLVLHDAALPDDPATSVDHVLVGPSGVYVVNIVAWSGAIGVRDDVLTVGGTNRSSALAEVAAAAEFVRGLLGGTPVAPLLCFERLEPVIGVAGDVALCASENILDLLTSQPQILDPVAVARASRSLSAAFRPVTRTPHVRSVDPAPAGAGPARPGPTLEELVAARAAAVADSAPNVLPGDPAPAVQHVDGPAPSAVEESAPKARHRFGLVRGRRASKRVVGPAPVAEQPVVELSVAEPVEHMVDTVDEVRTDDAGEASVAPAASSVRSSDAAVGDAGAALWLALTDAGEQTVPGVSGTEPADLEAALVEAETRQREADARDAEERERAARVDRELAEREARIRADRDAEDARERAELEARERAEEEAEDARQRAADEARKRAAREALERVEAEARELAEREAREWAEQERLEREAAEAQERAEQEAREHVEQEAREQAEQERLEREAAEAQERAEQEAREQAERGRLEQEATEAQERAEQEAREQAEREEHEREAAEARERAEQEAREQAEREQAEREAAEAQERAEQEARERAHQEAREQAEREQAEREAQVAEEATARAAWEARLLAGREARAREASDDALAERAAATGHAAVHQPDVRKAEVLEPEPSEAAVQEPALVPEWEPEREHEVVTAEAETETAEPETDLEAPSAIDLADWEPELRELEIRRFEPREADVPEPGARPAAQPRKKIRLHRREGERQRIPMRALLHVALGALLIAAVIVGAPRVHGLVEWGQGLFGKEAPTTVGTAVTVEATTFHPNATVLAGAPVPAEAQVGPGAAKGEHLVAVPLRLRNDGLTSWNVPLAAKAALIDTLGVSHPVARTVKAIKGHPLLAGQTRIAPGAEVTGYVVFSLPDGRTVRSVTLAPAKSGDDVVTWQVAP